MNNFVLITLLNFLAQLPMQAVFYVKCAIINYTIKIKKEYLHLLYCCKSNFLNIRWHLDFRQIIFFFSIQIKIMKVQYVCLNPLRLVLLFLISFPMRLGRPLPHILYFIADINAKFVSPLSSLLFYFILFCIIIFF